MAAAQQNARRRNFMSFLDKKMEAYRIYGQAINQPQMNFRNYLLDKRNLNFGFITRNQSNLEEINAFTLTADLLPATPRAFNINAVPLERMNPLFVDTERKFSIMMEDILSIPEFTLDLEQNLDHAFHGMSCILQIATYQYTYIIDPFSCYDFIRRDLAPILATNSHLKVMLGTGNDILALSRDYDINIAGVIDLQHLHQEIMRVLLGYVQNNEDEQITMRDMHGVLRRCLQTSTGQAMTIQQIQQGIQNLISLGNLTRIVLPSQQHPPDYTTMADWRLRPLPDGMLKYACFDVEVLLKIWCRMKLMVLRQENPTALLTNAINRTKDLLRNYFIPPTILTEQAVLEQHNIPGEQRPLFGLLWRWRQNYAKTFDENPDNILSIQDMRGLVANPLAFQTQEAVENYIRTRRNPDNPVRAQRRLPSESLTRWSHQVAQLITEGEERWERFLNTHCHICDNAFQYPHIALGCCQPSSAESRRNYFRNPVHQEERTRNYLAKRQRWERNRPNGAPYPY